jgi:hypothetical protein
MTRIAVDELLSLLDAAFDGEDWHSLLRNLRAVPAEAWEWVPPGGKRSVRDLAQHVGACKIMYANHGFGDATLTWDDPLVVGDGVLADPSSAIAWLREGQARLRGSVAALDDGELGRPRRAYWKAVKETRWGIVVMIQHDLYHAGEINHVRALFQGDDE